MRAGARALLRRRVTLLAPVRTETAGGGADIAFEEEPTVWAGIAARGAAEGEDAGRLRTRQTYEVTLRFRAGAAPGWRAVWDGRARRVIAARDPDGLRHRTILICEEEE